jgi:low affinity Fe/Cu permease
VSEVIFWLAIHPESTAGSVSSRLLRAVARAAGSQRTFTISLFLIAAWAVTGPFFHYSDTWQLAINTRTAILRFFMVLLIQHTQDRASTAAHAKLDELIRASEDARNVYVGLEKRSDDSLRQLRKNHLDAAYDEAQPATP